MDKRTEQIVRLYQTMPGAPPIPFDPDDGWLWGEVEGTEHWEFCAAIIDAVRDIQKGGAA